AGRIRKVLDAAGERIAAVGGLMPFYEAPLGPDWDDTVQATCAALARRERSGFKLRCGGVEAATFPSPAQVALALLACRDAGVPLKATAGLHHPIRHFSSSVQTKMHGFLNVFGAGLLAHIYHLSLEETATILADEDSLHFTFTSHDFSWKRFHITAEHIDMLRQRALISYGSCSFNEPRADLRAMGLLAQVPQKDNAA
ncbi:MAG TPA: hypothetical protein VKQ72_03115, partial [Aggregatilineales bacterium]|nr:hypothetical protein [Aggregatilineales bacterium]